MDRIPMHMGLANADKPIVELTDEATKAVFKQYRYRLEKQIGPGTLTSDNRRLRVRLDMRDENSATSVTGIKGTGLMLGLIEDTTRDFIHIHVHESEIHNFEAAFAESRSTPYKDDSQLIWEAYDTIENVPYVVRDAGPKGMGLFATQEIKKGVVFLTTPPATNISDEDWEILKQTRFPKFYGFKWGNGHSAFLGNELPNWLTQEEKELVGKTVLRNGLHPWNFVNDGGNDANASEKFESNVSIMTALRDIQPGEEITKGYNEKMDYASSWEKIT